MTRKINWSKGHYIPKNINKYIGKKKPIYRSSWELYFMRFCDYNPNILEWASEPIRIPYINPITLKKTSYVPDFLIKYVDVAKIEHIELIEIKPYNQSIITEQSSQRQRAIVAVNDAKWYSAQCWCNKHGIHFRIMTEYDIFAQYN